MQGVESLLSIKFILCVGFYRLYPAISLPSSPYIGFYLPTEANNISDNCRVVSDDRGRPPRLTIGRVYSDNFSDNCREVLPTEADRLPATLDRVKSCLSSRLTGPIDVLTSMVIGKDLAGIISDARSENKDLTSRKVSLLKDRPIPLVLHYFPIRVGELEGHGRKTSR